MTFVSAGLALAGVASVAIPIAIFLLWRQRRTPVEWAAMRFLLEAFRKHRRRLQIEQLLLLLVRCLALITLGAALARPILDQAGLLDAGGARQVYVVIDDGLVSGLEHDRDTTALDDQVARAKAIVEQLEPGDRVGVVTASRPARAILSPPSSDHGAVIELLESLEPSVTPTDLPGAISRVQTVIAELGAEHEQAIVYLLSDFRAGSASLEEALPPTLPPGMDDAQGIVLLASPPATESIGNVQITSVEPARSLILAGAVDGSSQVTVRLARRGGDLDRDVSQVRLAGDAVSSLEPRVVQWEPGQTEASCEFMLDVPAPRERETGISVVLDGDALAADNERHTVLALRRRVRAVLIDRQAFGTAPALDRLTAGQWMRRALAPTEDGPVEVVTVEPAALDPADLRVADVALLVRPDLLPDAGWAHLRSFVDKGGLLAVTPPADLRVHRWTDRLGDVLGVQWDLGREVRDVADGMTLADEQPTSALLRMISSDLAELVRPVVIERMLPVRSDPTRGETLLRLADGAPLMIAETPGPIAGEDDAEAAADAPRSRGLVVYLACAPELSWTNLPGKPLMVPLYQETIRQGLSLVRAGGSVEAGTQPPLFVGPASTALAAPDGERIDLDQVNRPRRALVAQGLYDVLDGAGQNVGAVAVNVDPAAGRTEPQPASAVDAWLGNSGPWEAFDPDDLTAALRRADSGSPIAGVLLIVLLALLILEMVLARVFSHATRSSGELGRGLRPTMSARADGGRPDLGGAA
jgi:hypothetical protein